LLPSSSIQNEAIGQLLLNIPFKAITESKKQKEIKSAKRS
jgi:hypothetical protein